MENKKLDDNLILVGMRPIMNYVFAVETQLKRNTEIFISARGKFISKAVDILEISKRNHKDLKVSIETESSTFKNKEEREINVSCIKIKINSERRLE